MHKKKRKDWKRYKSTESDADHTRACQVKNEDSKLTRQLCKEFEKDLSQNVKFDLKFFRRYCKLKNKPKISDIKGDGKRYFEVNTQLFYSLSDALPYSKQF